ncbi:MAG TPA: triose-phosphate isomerase family protein [Patescibacteria group bacterium]|nr:triose-phosphate isomerase family protein [Patescibacteria group bacterium]
MKSLLIVANFKSNKTLSEAKDWIKEISEKKFPEEKQIVVCPSFVHLNLFKNFVDENKLELKIGAQDISRFPQGEHTGEVNGSQLKELVAYVLIGHSERRAFEDESIIEEKVRIAIDYGLIPILCVQSENNKLYPGISIVAYEPTFAIGTGTPDTPEDADKIANEIKTKMPVKVLYGGSVTGENVKSFTGAQNIDGVLVGGASLSADEFSKILENS